jgi:hypothetical protein
MNALEEAVHDLYMMILRTLFGEEEHRAQNVVLAQGLTLAQRAQKIDAVIAPKINTNIIADAVKTDAMIKSAAAAAQLSAQAASLAKTAIVTATQARTVAANLNRTKGPPGWLGRLVQWGQLFQSQYYDWLWDHNQEWHDERVGVFYDKRSGPTWWERQRTGHQMKGPLWAYEYAEPPHWIGRQRWGAGPFANIIVPNFIENSKKKLPKSMSTPEAQIAQWVNELVWSGRVSEHKRRFGDVTRSLYDPQISAVFYGQNVKQEVDGRFSRLNAAELLRVGNWFGNALWLVWAMECWRANDPQRHLVSEEIERRWKIHAHRWGIGFVSSERLGERRLFGQNFEGEAGKVAANMRDNATLSINTETMLSLVMESTPFPYQHTVKDYRELFGTVPDWQNYVSGAFRPTPHAPRESAGKTRSWRKLLNDKVYGAGEKPLVQKAIEGVAKVGVSIMSSWAGGQLQAAAAPVLASFENATGELADEFVRELKGSGLWGLATTPIGKIADTWKTAAQDAFSDVWGLYDNLYEIVDKSSNVLDNLKAQGANIKGELEDLKGDLGSDFGSAYAGTRRQLERTLEAISEDYAHAEAVFGEVVCLPEQSKKMNKYL